LLALIFAITLQALKQRAADTQKIDLYIMTNFFPEMMAEVGDHKVSMLVPYHTRLRHELVLTGRVDSEARQAARSGTRESTTDLPVEALRADVDQPAREIIELCTRMTNDIIALETAALRRDTSKIFEVLTRISQQIRGAEALAKVQKEGMETI
jgi:AcrR family transcriptional regulator